MSDKSSIRMIVEKLVSVRAILAIMAGCAFLMLVKSFVDKGADSGIDLAVLTTIIGTIMNSYFHGKDRNGTNGS